MKKSAITVEELVQLLSSMVSGTSIGEAIMAVDPTYDISLLKDTMELAHKLEHEAFKKGELNSLMHWAGLAIRQKQSEGSIYSIYELMTMHQYCLQMNTSPHMNAMFGKKNSGFDPRDLLDLLKNLDKS